MRHSARFLASTFLAVLTLNAAPASAASITLAFDATITIANGHPELFLPGLGPGTSVTGTITITPDDAPSLFNLFLTVGDYDMFGWGANYLWTGAKGEAQNISTVSQSVLTPMESIFNLDWIAISFDAGWNSGSFNFIGQGLVPGTSFFQQSYVEGTITSIYAVPELRALALDTTTSAPEPGTISLLLLGALGLARQGIRRNGVRRSS